MPKHRTIDSSQRWKSYHNKKYLPAVYLCMYSNIDSVAKVGPGSIKKNKKHLLALPDSHHRIVALLKSKIAAKFSIEGSVFINWSPRKDSLYKRWLVITVSMTEVPQFPKIHNQTELRDEAEFISSARMWKCCFPGFQGILMELGSMFDS